LAEKMKIRLLRSIVLGGYKPAGRVINADEATAHKLIEAGMAKPVGEVEVKEQQFLFDDCG